MREAIAMPITRMIPVGLWLLLVGVILIWTIAAYSGEVDAVFRAEILIRHGLLMITLSMPSGLLLMFVLGTLADWLGIPTTGITDAILASIACGVAGYGQWFVLLPWLWRKWKARRAGGAVPSA